MKDDVIIRERIWVTKEQAKKLFPDVYEQKKELMFFDPLTIFEEQIKEMEK